MSQEIAPFSLDFLLGRSVSGDQLARRGSLSASLRRTSARAWVRC